MLRELDQSFHYPRRANNGYGETNDACLLDAVGIKELASILETKQVRDMLGLIPETVGSFRKRDEGVANPV